MVYWLFSDYFRSLVGVYLFVKKFREIPHLMGFLILKICEGLKDLFLTKY